MMKHIPNFITSLNLIAGFFAAIATINGNLNAAFWFIAAAMVFDFLDGLASRLLNAYSGMGKELDSLADLVSFGVVPGMIIYKLFERNLTGGVEITTNIEQIKVILTIVAALFPLCAGLRLARFNTDPMQSVSFRGLPTPAAALAIISIIPVMTRENGFVSSITASNYAIAVYSLALSALMVSRLPMLSLKTKNFRFAGNEPKYILAAVASILIILFGFSGTALIIPAYIIISLIFPPA